MKNFVKLAIAGTAMIAAAGSANAADILNVASIQSPYTHVPTADLNELSTPFARDNTKVTPFKVTGTLNGNAVELFAYCVDIFQAASHGNFTVVSLLDYVSGNNAKAKLVSALIDAEGGSLTTLLGKEHDASVQMALWEIFSEGSLASLDVTAGNFSITDTNASLTTDANAFIAAAAGVPKNQQLKLFVATNDRKQDMLFWSYSPAVPEPATWAMMILGMGAVGASLRQARRKTTVSFA